MINCMYEDTSMRIKKSVKKKLLELDFVKRQSENDIVLYLINFYKNKGKPLSTHGKPLLVQAIRKKGKRGKWIK